VLGVTGLWAQYYPWAAAARALQLRGRRPRPIRPSGALSLASERAPDPLRCSARGAGDSRPLVVVSGPSRLAGHLAWLRPLHPL